jgi:hypothetical protein
MAVVVASGAFCLSYLNSHSPPWTASVFLPADLHDRDSCERQTMTSPTNAATHYTPSACQGWARAWRRHAMCVCVVEEMRTHHIPSLSSPSIQPPQLSRPNHSEPSNFLDSQICPDCACCRRLSILVNTPARSKDGKSRPHKRT